MAIPNLTDYQDKKIKELISIQRIDEDNFAVCEKKFDLVKAALGELEELPAEVKGVTLTEVEAEITRLTDENKGKLDALKSFKADLVAAI